MEFFFPTGREIEGVINQGRVPLWVSPSKFPAGGSSYQYDLYGKEWKLTTDRSVKNHDGTNGFEISSPILQGKEAFEQIAHVLNMLKETGALVDSRCGLHIHIGVQPDLKLPHFKNLLKLQLNLEDSFDYLVDASRRCDNPHCNSNLSPFYRKFMARFADEPTALWTVDGRAKLVSQADTFIDNASKFMDLVFTRRLKLNISAFMIHDTIEIRHHHGTLDYTEIVNWLQLQMALVEKAKSANEVKPASEFFNGPQKAFTTLAVNKEVAEYYLKNKSS
ncbi:MAG TPA: hypothetical protein ENI48_01250 [Thioploca sp.]|nr:MAG: hypothetical protein B6247_26610 [Beggiatoa sp. 4572_84]HEC83861.1 hypothetical protein [Thioploca sp.]